ncbi:MAG: hypothetical protein QM785_19605 [Pyrinomonadaceae bacterium]
MNTNPSFEQMRREVAEIVAEQPVIDIHTHLFPPQFGAMNHFGIDELLTYHYLVAEVFRSSNISTDAFWLLSKREQADLIWQKLFVENSPISEAARGVITVLNAFGLDTNTRDLTQARDFFASVNVHSHVDTVLKTAGVSDVVMTNDPFDTEETAFWSSEMAADPRFHAALRMDRLLNSWPQTFGKLQEFGHAVDAGLGGDSVTEIRKFLDRWIAAMKPLYMAVSLPDDFQFPDDDERQKIITDVVLPTAREHDLPFALMIGVRRGVNPSLRGAGDGVGRADVGSLERICVANPDVRFLASFLSRENQHELCVAARKFSNLMPFGCWWFLNNPSIISEITRERLELLGTSFIPQHSDSRVLEQLIYKWDHSRHVIADCLFDSYAALALSGRIVSRDDISRDVKRLFNVNFSTCVRL